jgi:hypothetical protein
MAFSYSALAKLSFPLRMASRASSAVDEAAVTHNEATNSAAAASLFRITLLPSVVFEIGGEYSERGRPGLSRSCRPLTVLAQDV